MIYPTPPASTSHRTILSLSISLHRLPPRPLLNIIATSLYPFLPIRLIRLTPDEPLPLIIPLDFKPHHFYLVPHLRYSKLPSNLCRTLDRRTVSFSRHYVRAPKTPAQKHPGGSQKRAGSRASTNILNLARCSFLLFWNLGPLPPKKLKAATPSRTNTNTHHHALLHSLSTPPSPPCLANTSTLDTQIFRSDSDKEPRPHRLSTGQLFVIHPSLSRTRLRRPSLTASQQASVDRKTWKTRPVPLRYANVWFAPPTVQNIDALHDLKIGHRSTRAGGTKIVLKGESS